jgi:hypothetical protein
MLLPAVQEAYAANDCSPAAHAEPSRRVALVAQGGGACIQSGFDSGNEKRRGRPRKYASDAERKAAYRAAKARIDYTDKPEIKATISRLAQQFEVGENEVLQELVRFALCNRDWARLGFAAKRVNGALQ